MTDLTLYTPLQIMQFKPPNMNLALVPPSQGGGGGGGGGGGWAQVASRPASLLPNPAAMNPAQGLIPVANKKKVWSLKHAMQLRQMPVRGAALPCLSPLCVCACVCVCVRLVRWVG